MDVVSLFRSMKQNNKASNDVFVIFVAMCCTTSDVVLSEIYIYRETIDCYMLVVNIENDTPKIIDN